ncbi:unnamed protein product, partial [Rotaria sp. Silwood1]
MTDDEYWLFSQHLKFLCNFWHSMGILASTASILALSAIGIDRYLMVDPDAPRRGNEIAGPWLHWIKASFKGDNVDSGTTLADYQGPTPPDGTGPHQYIILLYKSASSQIALDGGSIG